MIESRFFSNAALKKTTSVLLNFSFCTDCIPSWAVRAQTGRRLKHQISSKLGLFVINTAHWTHANTGGNNYRWMQCKLFFFLKTHIFGNGRSRQRRVFSIGLSLSLWNEFDCEVKPLVNTNTSREAFSVNTVGLNHPSVVQLWHGTY